jgi:PAS domain S-box-containing protein
MEKSLSSDLRNKGVIKYKILFDLAPVGISVVDKERRIIKFNEALQKTARRPKKGLEKEIYKKLRYYSSDGKAISADQLPPALALIDNRIVKNIEVGTEDEKGKLFWVDVSAAPLYPECTPGVVITEDITESKNQHSKLPDSKEKFR